MSPPPLELLSIKAVKTLDDTIFESSVRQNHTLVMMGVWASSCLYLQTQFILFALKLSILFFIFRTLPFVSHLFFLKTQLVNICYKWNTSSECRTIFHESSSEFFHYFSQSFFSTPPLTFYFHRLPEKKVMPFVAATTVICLFSLAESYITVCAQ